jgi:thiamine biosynthesis lipoprotein
MSMTRGAREMHARPLSTTARSSWEALGTSAVLQVTDLCALARARAIVKRELDLIDRACSRFRPDSDLQRVNTAQGRYTSVSPLLIEAVQVALDAAELTGGDVDPTVGNALVLAGYDRDWAQLERPIDGPEPAGVSESPGGPCRGDRPARVGSRGDPADRVWSPCPTIHARVTPGWRAIEIDRERTAIRVPTGVRLDLGATAKAWAADRAAAAVHEATGAGSLLGLGGDIATAGAAPAGGWRIYVTDDHRSAPGTQGQTVAIRSGAIATSSTAVRRWMHEGRTRHHIIDPATSAPVARTWRTVSIAAETCLDANIASTAALIRAGSAPDWLERLGLPARLVSTDGAVRLVSGWPAPAEESPVDAAELVASGPERASR